MAFLQNKAMATAIAFFGGFTVKNMTATMSSPSSMVVVVVVL